MEQIVSLIGGDVRVSTFDIFKGLQYNTHAKLKEVINNNKSDFEQLGILPLESEKPLKGSKGGRPQESFLLNEDQFVLLVILCKNSPNSIKLKVRVSEQFSRMKKELANIATNSKNAEWIEARKEGKLSRRHETDVIKMFVDYAESQGGSVKGCGLYYANISKMENAALFIVEQKHKNLRAVLGLVDLRTVQQADMIVAKALKDGMDQEMNYTDIYQLAKTRVQMFAEVRGQSLIGSDQVKALNEK